MRIDKFTTHFQLALGDAQSIAAGRRHQSLEPAHLLLALLDRTDGTVRHILSRSSVKTDALRSQLGQMIDSFVQVEGPDAGDIQPSRALMRHLNICDRLAQKRKDSYIASELFVLACLEAGGECADLLMRNGATKQSLTEAIDELRQGESVSSQNAEEHQQSPREIHHRPHRARRPRGTRSGDRTRR